MKVTNDKTIGIKPKMTEVIKRHKFMTTICFITLALVISNLAMIYSFINVLLKG